MLTKTTLLLVGLLQSLCAGVARGEVGGWGRLALMESCISLSPFLLYSMHCLQSAHQPPTPPAPSPKWLTWRNQGLWLILLYWVGYSVPVTAHLIKTIKKWQTWKNLDKYTTVLSLHRGEYRLGDLFIGRKFSVSRFSNSQSDVFLWDTHWLLNVNTGCGTCFYLSYHLVIFKLRNSALNLTVYN